MCDDLLENMDAEQNGKLGTYNRKLRTSTKTEENLIGF
jgi:hypothetical protein